MIEFFAPTLYYVAGAATVYLWALLETRAEKRNQNKWKSVENLRWVWDFDYTLKESLTALQIARDIASIAVKQVEKDRERIMLETIQVDPGDYTIRMSLNASFIEREEGWEPDEND